MESDGSFRSYAAHRRPLAPSHPLFEAGNWRRDLLAKDNAAKVRYDLREIRLSATQLVVLDLEFFAALSMLLTAPALLAGFNLAALNERL